MLKSIRLNVLIATVAVLWSSTSVAENWPGWRGPRGDGSSMDRDVPLKWDGAKGENVRWKTPIPGKGHSSPITWGGRVFVTTCLEDNGHRLLYCVDRDSGKIAWEREVVKSPLESIHKLNSRASSTPASDGESIYVTFLETDGSTVPAPNVGSPRPITPGTIVVAAYELDGTHRWTKRPGNFVSAHGFCSSPVLYENLVIVNGDHDGESYIVALDKATGEPVWKVKRAHKTRSYVTPLIRQIGGRTQLVFSGSKHIISLNPADGSEHWSINGPTEQFVASMVYDGDHFFMAAGFPTYHVMAIRPDGRGDVTETHVTWHVQNAKCYVPSPVVVDDYLLVADDRGTANCFATGTGERLWQERMGRHFSASLVTANGLVYFLADDGEMRIIRPGPKLDVVATNPLGEFCYASPAIADSRLFIRGTNHLYCIAAGDRTAAN